MMSREQNTQDCHRLIETWMQTRLLCQLCLAVHMPQRTPLDTSLPLIALAQPHKSQPKPGKLFWQLQTHKLCTMRPDCQPFQVLTALTAKLLAKYMTKL
jgi:hypothetical protein